LILKEFITGRQQIIISLAKNLIFLGIDVFRINFLRFPLSVNPFLYLPQNIIIYLRRRYTTVVINCKEL